MICHCESFDFCAIKNCPLTSLNQKCPLKFEIDGAMDVQHYGQVSAYTTKVLFMPFSTFDSMMSLRLNSLKLN
jgi:hypothetical protein